MKLMNTAFVVLSVSLIALVSCSDDKNPAQQYGNTMVQSVKSAKSVENKVNVDEVRKSIQEFNAANGRYPADLNELSAFNGVALKSDRYVYDPLAGTLAEKQ
jgi:hypothetical protein